ncbi:MAG: GreA/GreB family elongation factor [Pontibacterium sp.]
MRYLSKRLDDITTVDRIPADTGTVFFGAWVTVEDEDGEQHRYRIVGPDEVGDAPGYISIDSPLARLLVKKRIGDEIDLIKPNGDNVWYEITNVDYQQYKTDL